jgi:hypothetical protein
LNLILDEVLEIINIEIKESMDDYTKEELRIILDIFRELQDKYPPGICLSREIHKEFHSIYGFGYNTQEQWNEFINIYYKQKVSA